MSGKSSEFMINLQKQLMEKRNLNENTANKYIQLIFTLNDKEPFKNLAFLKKYEELEKKISTYAENTRHLFITAIVSTLSMFSTKPTYKPIYSYWEKKMNESKEQRSEADPHKMSETQEQNWTEWNDIVKKKQQLGTETSSFLSSKKLSEEQYDTLLQFVILSIYTDIAPRRNQDYMFMNMIKKLPKDAPTDKNYYEIDKQQFIFNKYKTAKSYGQTILPVPEELQKTLALYIKHHPNKTKLKEGTPLLVKYDGTQLNTTNGITRILNKIFGKNVGSSMLRHSYLTTKYADNLKEMKQDQVGMGHSASVQASYIKLADEPKNEVVEPAVNYIV